MFYTRWYLYLDEVVLQGDCFEGQGPPGRGLRVIDNAHAALDGLRVIDKGFYQLYGLVRAQNC